MMFERDAWKFRGAHAHMQLWLGKSWEERFGGGHGLMQRDRQEKAFQVKGILIGPSFRKHWAYARNVTMVPLLSLLVP